MPMLARQERTLAIDGVYVHVSFITTVKVWSHPGPSPDHAFCKQGQSGL